MSAGRPVRVVVACPGLDHAHRGFETFAREVFGVLRESPALQVELLKGSGRGGGGERVAPALLRDTRVARRLAQASRREPFVIEHVSFAAGALPLLHRHRPDVVYFSEWHVGRVLAAWRKATRSRYALVFCNGALAAGPYDHLDHVQQLVPGALEHVVERGVSPRNQSVLPLGLAIDRDERPITSGEQIALRRRLGLPTERSVVLSVGAINNQKRMTYVIEEIASLPEPRPFLLLAGQLERESPPIVALARQRLGRDGHEIRTVPPSEMPNLYRASDVFVLASLWESFGRVLVEALSHGLPCVAHDYPVMRWVLGEHGHFEDLTRRGTLAGLIRELDQGAVSPLVRANRHRAAYERFSWDLLAPRYVEMLQRAAGSLRADASAEG